MWSTPFDKARLLICCVVVFLEFKLQVQAFRVSRSEEKCDPGTYRSEQLFGQCAQCPENCTRERLSDIEPCRKACGTYIEDMFRRLYTYICSNNTIYKCNSPDLLSLITCL